MSISSKNSSGTPLLSGQTFVGSAEDITAWSSLCLSFKADTQCTVSYAFSSDGESWDYSTSQVVSSGSPFFASAEVKSRYLKVTVQNDGDDQTYLRLLSILRKEPTNVGIEELPPITIDNSSSSVVVYGKNGLNPDALQTDGDGVLYTAIQNSPYVQQMGAWNVTSQITQSNSSVQVFGINDGDNVPVKCEPDGTLDVRLNSVAVSLHVHLDDVSSAYRNLNLGTTSSQVGSSSATKLCSCYIMNNSAGKRYVKLYNSASATESNTPVYTLVVPSESPIFMQYSPPILFDTSLCLRGTTGLADNDTGAPASNDIVVAISYGQ